METIEFLESPYEDHIHLIDGDILAYRASAATDGRGYFVGQELFKYAKEAYEYAESIGLDKSAATLVFDPEPPENCISILKDILNMFPKKEVYLSDATNFRYQIYPQYKESRENLRRPKNLQAAKDWLLKQGAILKENLEADDCIIMRAKELGDTPHVLVSIDKDFLQYPGIHMNPFTREVLEISPAEARKNFWIQVCIGDPTDGIVSPKGLGKKRASLVLDKIDWERDTEWQIFLDVLDLYKSYTPPEPEEDVEAYIRRVATHLHIVASLVHLKRTEDDIWEIPKKIKEGPEETEEETEEAGAVLPDPPILNEQPVCW